MESILFLEPIFKEMIWGGNRMRDIFSYEFSGENIGECWGISANKNGDCFVKDGEFKGKRLSEVWREKKEFFGNYSSDIFPLLIKIIDAKTDLSIQVHPDDTYADSYEKGSLGKTECWLILDCKDDASIVIGHHAKDKKEMEEMILNSKWNDFIREIPIKKGDFFQIDPGCLHAIKGGTLILETQQNSDITFRVYDYDRLQDGKKRQLHIKESIDCINAPFIENEAKPSVENESYGKHIHYIDSKYYSVDRYIIKEKMYLDISNYFTCVTVLNGEGTVNGKKVKKGEHFIISSLVNTCEIAGNIDIICSYPL